MTFIALIELAGAFNFDIVLIQRQNPTREHYDTAFTLSLGFALFCGGTIAALSPLAADFYSEPRLVPIMLVLGAAWAIQGLENIGIVNFRRDMDFGREFRFTIARRLLGFVVTVVLAFTLRSYWALIAGIVTTRVSSVVLSYVMEPYRPRLSLSARKDLFGFSGWMFVSNIIGFGLARMTHFVVGRVNGPEALGLYTIASEMARLPSTELSAPINRAVLPGLSRVNEDVAKWRALFIDVQGTTIAVTLPTCIGLVMLAGPFVEVVLGMKWVSAVPVLIVLALGGAVEVMTANTGIAYLSLGKANVIAAVNATKLALLGAFAWWLVPEHGVIGMALAELGAAVVAICISLPVVMRIAHIPVRQMVAALWRPVLASAVMAGGLYQLVGPPLAQAGAHPRPASILFVGMAVGATLYLVTVFGLWALAGRPVGAERHFFSIAQQAITRLRARLRNADAP
jgi:lipopolysaccharide exporter